jgi:UDP-N-acetylglucosamine 2-epimerase (non-hydrolysing)
MKILLVAGARPNFMKIAPLIRQLRTNDKMHRINGLSWKLIHTGQHYDFEMSKVFFDDLDIPKPDYFLNAGSGTHAEQTAKVMVEFEKVCFEERPDVVVVVGDVNSTLACSVIAKKLNIKVAHVEAGLRSGDMSMPEEINRIVTDSISDYLFVTEESGIENLKKEGKNEEQVFFVGNIMIDTLYYSLKKLEDKKLRKSGVGKSLQNSNHHPNANEYAVVTLHRPSNVDDKEKLEDIILALKEISKDMAVYFPMHPRTKKSIETFKMNNLLNDIAVVPPMSYLEFLALWKDASLVLTDSGGLQEETTALGIPCFTIRENTERPVTIEKGTNTLVGTSRKSILEAYKEFKEGKRKKWCTPELWDGETSERIVNIIFEKYYI